MIMRRWLATAILALLLIGPGGPAWGHVTDVMPDAVAEMEYQILLDFQPDKVEVRNKLAMVLYRKKKFKEAEAEFRTVLATAPTNFDALDGLGLVMGRTARTKEAISQFEAAIRVNAQDVMVHYHLGQALAGEGDLPAAAKSLARAAELAGQPTAVVSEADRQAIRQAVAETEQKLHPGAGPPAAGGATGPR